MSDSSTTADQPYDDGPRTGMHPDHAEPRTYDADAGSNDYVAPQTEADRARLDEALQRSRNLDPEAYAHNARVTDEPVTTEVPADEVAVDAVSHDRGDEVVGETVARDDRRFAEPVTQVAPDADPVAGERIAAEHAADGAAVAERVAGEPATDTRVTDTPVHATTTETVGATVAGATAASAPATETTVLEEERRTTPVREVDRTSEGVLMEELDPAAREGLLVEPDRAGNRLFGFLMTLITTAAFAAGFVALFAFLRMFFNDGESFTTEATNFLGTAPAYLPIAVVFVLLTIWSLLSNRAGWWSFILAGLVIGLAAFAAYHVGVALQEAINLGGVSNFSTQSLIDSVRAPEHLPGALIAFIVGRETVTWLGGFTALRGRRVKRRNAAERAEYDRLIALERAEAGTTEVVTDKKTRKTRIRD